MGQNISLKKAQTAPKAQWETREFFHGLKRPWHETEHVVPRLRKSGAVTPFSHIRVSSWFAVMASQFSVTTTHTRCTESMCEIADETQISNRCTSQ